MPHKAYAGLLFSRYSYPEVMEALRELGATDNEADGMVDALSADGWNGLGEKALTKAELQAAIEAYRASRAA